jgi:hypothetical protein
MVEPFLTLPLSLSVFSLTQVRDSPIQVACACNDKTGTSKFSCLQHAFEKLHPASNAQQTKASVTMCCSVLNPCKPLVSGSTGEGIRVREASDEDPANGNHPSPDWYRCIGTQVQRSTGERLCNPSRRAPTTPDQPRAKCIIPLFVCLDFDNHVSKRAWTHRVLQGGCLDTEVAFERRFRTYGQSLLNHRRQKRNFISVDY